MGSKLATFHNFRRLIRNFHIFRRSIRSSQWSQTWMLQYRTRLSPETIRFHSIMLQWTCCTQLSHPSMHFHLHGDQRWIAGKTIFLFYANNIKCLLWRVYRYIQSIIKITFYFKLHYFKGPRAANPIYECYSVRPPSLHSFPTLARFRLTYNEIRELNVTQYDPFPFTFHKHQLNFIISTSPAEGVWPNGPPWNTCCLISKVQSHSFIAAQSGDIVRVLPTLFPLSTLLNM